MGKVEQYTQEAIDIANDNSHGYSQQSRWGNPDFDCSSLVVTVVQNAGIPVRTNGASYTGNMKSAFLRSGFKDVTSSCNLSNGGGMVRGDILLNQAAHTAIYIGNGRVVHARSSEGNTMPGDQSGNEIRCQNYWNYPWDTVMRFSESATSPAESHATPAVSGGTQTTQTPTQASTLLRKGSKGAKVKELQGQLMKLGYDLGKWGADGDFGNDTYNAVIKFQKDHNLEVDGVVGKNTREAIEKALKSKETPKTESIKNTEKFAKGDVVMFKGGKHYLSSRATAGTEAKPGKAKITMIFSGMGVKHPYHLVRTVGGGSNVYGWVDEADIEAL